MTRLGRSKITTTATTTTTAGRQTTRVASEIIKPDNGQRMLPVGPGDEIDQIAAPEVD